MTLAENLAVEAAARRESDTSLLRAVNHGPRLVAMERRIEQDAVAKRRVVETYRFDSLTPPAASTGRTARLGASLGFDATGTIERVTFDEAGAETGRVDGAVLHHLRAQPGHRRPLADRRRDRRVTNPA